MAYRQSFRIRKIYAENSLEITEVINERKLIDRILSEQDVFMDSSNMFTFLWLMAKHCYFDLGYREKKTMDFLDEFLDKNFPIYDMGEYKKLYEYDSDPSGSAKNHFNYYNRAFKSAYKLAEKSANICEKDGFWITKSELAYIGELHDKVLERIAFVLLCYAKLYKLRNSNANGWVYNSKTKDVFKQARVVCKVLDRHEYYGTLIEKGYLHEYQRPDGDLRFMSQWEYERYQKRMLDVRVTFMDENSEKVIWVDDFRELGYYYRQYKGENIIKCAKCGKLTRGNKNGTKKYCRECAGTSTGYKVAYKFCRCKDCGKVFEIPINDNIEFKQRKRKRCDDCREEERKRHNREQYKRRKQANSTN